MYLKYLHLQDEIENKNTEAAETTCDMKHKKVEQDTESEDSLDLYLNVTYAGENVGFENDSEEQSFEHGRKDTKSFAKCVSVIVIMMVLIGYGVLGYMVLDLKTKLKVSRNAQENERREYEGKAQLMEERWDEREKNLEKELRNLQNENQELEKAGSNRGKQLDQEEADEAAETDTQVKHLQVFLQGLQKELKSGLKAVKVVRNEIFRATVDGAQNDSIRFVALTSAILAGNHDILHAVEKELDLIHFSELQMIQFFEFVVSRKHIEVMDHLLALNKNVSIFNKFDKEEHNAIHNTLERVVPMTIDIDDDNCTLTTKLIRQYGDFIVTYESQQDQHYCASDGIFGHAISRFITDGKSLCVKLFHQIEIELVRRHSII